MKNKGGRPTSVTEEALKKLELAFAEGATDAEACFLADISPATLYNYQEKHPEFIERKEGLKSRPIMLARKTVNEGIKHDPDLALRFLERKKKDEFSVRQEFEHSGPDGAPIPIDITKQIEKIYGSPESNSSGT